jgi:hypothetical protein
MSVESFKRKIDPILIMFFAIQNLPSKFFLNLVKKFYVPQRPQVLSGMAKILQ